MFDSALPPQRRAPRCALLLAILALACLALGAGRAAASQVQAVTLESCVPISGGGCSYESSVRVDQDVSLRASFKVTNSLGVGSSLFVELPAGAQFLGVPQVQINFKGTGYSPTEVMLTNEGRRLQIPIPKFLVDIDGPITSADEVSLLLATGASQVRVPAVPGSVRVEVWSTSDVDPRPSSAFTTTLGLPAAIVSGGTRTATVDTSPVLAPEAQLTDSRGNGIPDAELTFEAPAGSGAGGAFGGSATATGETDAQGKATPGVALKANTKAGEWTLAVHGPDSTSGSIAIVNRAGEAKSVELEIAPASFAADGKAQAAATIDVRDEFGNRVGADAISLTSPTGGPAAGTPQVQPDGTYSATLTASKTPGEFAIVATDSSVTPNLTDSVTVTQTALPATTIELRLSPREIRADGSSATTAIVTLRDAIGGPVAGETVTIASSAGNPVGPVTDHGHGTYSALVTSTTAPGAVTITARDTSVVPALERAVTLTQTAVPPPPPPPPPASAPSVTIKGGPKGKTRAKRAAFRFAANGPAAWFECKLDGRKWARCKSPKRYAVKPGRHTFRVRAVAASGEPGPVAKRSFKRLAPK